MKLTGGRIAAGAVLVAGAAALVPVLWVAAVLAVPLGIIVTSGRARWMVVGLGLPLLVVSFLRFTFENARRHFDAADIETGEKNALSRVREIYWAESQARKLALVNPDATGAGEYLSMAELVGHARARIGVRPPLLKPGLYSALDATRGVYQSEGYLYAVYLPGRDGQPTTQASAADAIAGRRAFAVYAWPADRKRGGHRMYFVDQFEQICESNNPEEFYGPERLPEPSAYALMASSGVSQCGRDDDPGPWHPWGSHDRTKDPRAER